VSVKLVLVAACALIDPDGRILLAQRPQGKAMAGLWEFPGGKVEPGERPETSLIRELQEELGIVVKEECLAPLTFVDAALCVPALGRDHAAAGSADAQMGAAERFAQLSDAARRRAFDTAPDDAAVTRMKMLSVVAQEL
jgi:ADP-ribose pyrophosphatase YjhB (NUDIX family)